MQQIDTLMRDYDGAVPGASVAVVADGRVVFRKSYGMADLEQHLAAAPDTNYRLASVSKQITAAATLLALGPRLDDPITTYLPSLPAYAKAITVRHLLIHTSGLLAYEDLIPPGTTKQLKDADVLRLLEQRETTYFPPGTGYRYSNTGYAFLALIVERVSGRSFADFLRRNVFLPAGMKATVAFEEGISTVPCRAYGYSRDDPGWRRTDQSLTSAVLGDGGMYSSVDDLVQWLQFVEGGRFDQAFVPAVQTDDPAVRYGFGWRISEHRGHRTIGHSGETIGFRNAIVRFPDQHLAVIVLTNRNSKGTLSSLALAIADMFMP